MNIFHKLGFTSACINIVLYNCYFNDISNIIVIELLIIIITFVILTLLVTILTIANPNKTKSNINY